MTMRRSIKGMALALLMALSVPAWADKLYVLHPSAAEAPATNTVTTAPGLFDTTGNAFLSCAVSITAGSGTATAVDIWLQGSYDGGVTWVDIIFDSGMKTTTTSTGTGTAATWTTPRRELVAEAAAVTTSSQYFGVAHAGIPPLIRAAWEYTWTVATSETFSVACSLKD